MRFRVMRFRASSAAPPSAEAGGSAVIPALAIPAGLADVDGDIARPTAESQQAGIDHLVRIAMEQGAARCRRVAEPAQLTPPTGPVG